jgi:hypothetical protein
MDHAFEVIQRLLDGFEDSVRKAFKHEVGGRGVHSWYYGVRLLLVRLLRLRLKLRVKLGLMFNLESRLTLRPRLNLSLCD